MAGGEFDRSSDIRTSFRPRMWWLTLIRGYKMVSLHRLPKQNSFGEIYYLNVWILSKDASGSHRVG